jgi:hypothetical protein
VEPTHRTATAPPNKRAATIRKGKDPPPTSTLVHVVSTSGCGDEDEEDDDEEDDDDDDEAVVMAIETSYRYAPARLADMLPTPTTVASIPKLRPWNRCGMYVEDNALRDGSMKARDDSSMPMEMACTAGDVLNKQANRADAAAAAAAADAAVNRPREASAIGQDATAAVSRRELKRS